MQRTAWFAVIGTALLFGCTPIDRGLPYAPVFNTGVRATIISPGQNAPPMPGQRASTSGASGQQSGYPGQPGGGPPPGTPPSAYGSQGELQSLGGAVTVDTREIEKPRNSLSGSPLMLPFAIVAWPFEKIAQAVDEAGGGPTQSETLAERAEAIVAAGGGPISQPGAREQVQQDYERNEVESMERQLAQRQGGGYGGSSAGPAQVATAQTAGGGTLSIADELAALRSRGAPSAANSAALQAPATSASAAANGAKDRDGDGQPDAWVFESNGKKTRAAYDDDGDGRPERVEYFDIEGDEVARIEHDTDGDGAPDSWVLNEKGKLAQRRADTNQDGQVDSWTFYDERGQIARQAQDLDGDGTRDRTEIFEGGKIARRTEDLDGDGQPDRTTRFDAKGNQTELEEDKDGDGQVDVKSYYADGRLVKREILDTTEAEATP